MDPFIPSPYRRTAQIGILYTAKEVINGENKQLVYKAPLPQLIHSFFPLPSLSVRHCPQLHLMGNSWWDERI